MHMSITGDLENDLRAFCLNNGLTALGVAREAIASAIRLPAAAPTRTPTAARASVLVPASITLDGDLSGRR